jgi:hypothetical protein
MMACKHWTMRAGSMGRAGSGTMRLLQAVYASQELHDGAAAISRHWCPRGKSHRMSSTMVR